MTEPEKSQDNNERRDVPIHVLTYLDERLRTHTEKIERMIADHIAEEADHYDQIANKLEVTADESAARHTSLLQSIHAYMGKQEVIETAFLKNAEGHPDYHGHHCDHDRRKQVAEWWHGTKDKALTKVIEWGVLGFVAWLFYALWAAALKGPKQ